MVIFLYLIDSDQDGGFVEMVPLRWKLGVTDIRRLRNFAEIAFQTRGDVCYLEIDVTLTEAVSTFQPSKVLTVFLEL